MAALKLVSVKVSDSNIVLKMSKAICHWVPRKQAFIAEFQSISRLNSCDSQITEDLDFPSFPFFQSLELSWRKSNCSNAACHLLPWANAFHHCCIAERIWAQSHRRNLSEELTGQVANWKWQMLQSQDCNFPKSFLNQVCPEIKVKTVRFPSGLDFSQALITALRMISFGWKLSAFWIVSKSCKAQVHCDAFSQALMAAPKVILFGTRLPIPDICWRRLNATCHSFAAPQIVIAVVKDTTSQCPSASIAVNTICHECGSLGLEFKPTAFIAAVRPTWSDEMDSCDISEKTCRAQGHCLLPLANLSVCTSLMALQAEL